MNTIIKFSSMEEALLWYATADHQDYKTDNGMHARQALREMGSKESNAKVLDWYQGKFTFTNKDDDKLDARTAEPSEGKHSSPGSLSFMAPKQIGPAIDHDEAEIKDPWGIV